MSEPIIAMMGGFRSGTNYAKTLLERNYHCRVRNHVFGWKHWFLPIISMIQKQSVNLSMIKRFLSLKIRFHL